MDDFTTTLRILKDILEKKYQALQNILSITQNQETILVSPPSAERNGFFAETNVEKQKFIDNVRDYDDVFQGIFDSIRDGLDQNVTANMEDNRPEIIALQALISRILEQDIQIRAQELENNKYLTPAPSPPPRPQPNRSQVIQELNKHKRPQAGS